MKKRVWLAVILLVCLSLLFPAGSGKGTIGKIQGAEWDVVVIDEAEYAKTTGSGISALDKGAYLGKVTDGGRVAFRVYSVKNDTEGRYIYCLWDWEGRIYERK